MAAAAESLQSTVELVLGADVGMLTDDQRSLLETGWRNGRRLLGLIGDLHTVALVEAGLYEVEWASVDLHELSTRAAEAVWPVAHATGKALRVETAGTPHAIGAQDVLARALDALLEYVVEHAQRGGETVVTAGDSAVTITYPAAARVNEDDLALALAQAVARLHGGEVVVARADGAVTLSLTLGAVGDAAHAA